MKAPVCPETHVNQGIPRQILLVLLLQRWRGVVEVRPLKPEDSKSMWHSLRCLKIHGFVP